MVFSSDPLKKKLKRLQRLERSLEKGNELLMQVKDLFHKINENKKLKVSSEDSSIILETVAMLNNSETQINKILYEIKAIQKNENLEQIESDKIDILEINTQELIESVMKLCNSAMSMVKVE